MADKKHLVQRGNIWWFVRRVPDSLKHLYPDVSRIQKSLDTSDIRIARVRRDIMVGDMQKLSLSSTIGNENALFKHYVSMFKKLKADEEADLARQLAAMTPDERRRKREAEFAGVASVETSTNVWDRVWSPDEAGKEDDKAYVAAFRAVTSGKDDAVDLSITIKAALSEYLEARKGQVSNAATRMVARTVDLLLGFLGESDIRAKDLERRQVYDWLRQLEGNFSNSTIRTHLSNMRGLFDWLINRGDLEGHSVFDRQKVNTVKGGNKYQLFDGSELKKLNTQLKTQHREVDLLFKLGLHTGARLAELGGLKLSQVVLDADIPHLLIKSGKQKTGATPQFRTVPLADAVVSMVQMQVDRAKTASSEYLFCDTVTETRKDGRVEHSISLRFSKIKTKVTKDPTKAFHSLRVHAATWCQAQDIPEHVTSTLLGHTNGQTMSYAYYAKQNPDLKPYKEAIEKLAKKVAEALA